MFRLKQNQLDTLFCERGYWHTSYWFEDVKTLAIRLHPEFEAEFRNKTSALIYFCRIFEKSLISMIPMTNMIALFQDKSKVPFVSRTLIPLSTEEKCEEYWKNAKPQPSIKILHGFNCEITNGMLKIMAMHIDRVYPSVEIIDLRENFLTEHCIDFIHDLLKNVQHLKFLILLKNPILHTELTTSFETKMKNTDITEELVSRMIWLPWVHVIDKVKATNKYGQLICKQHNEFYIDFAKHLNFTASEMFPQSIINSD